MQNIIHVFHIGFTADVEKNETKLFDFFTLLRVIYL